MQASPHPIPFLDTYNLSISFLEFKALCNVIEFLASPSICLSSSLVYFKNGPEYLTKGTAQVFIPSMRFLLQILVLENFSFVGGIFFSFSFYLRLYDGIRFQYSPALVMFLSSKKSDSFLIW